MKRLILLSILAMNSVYAKAPADTDASYNLQPGSKEVFSCAVKFLQEKKAEANNVGGYYLAELLKANVLSYEGGSYSLPDRAKKVKEMEINCAKDLDKYKEDETLPSTKYPALSEYIPRVNSVMMAIKNKLGLCWSNEFSGNAGILLVLGAGFSGGQCFRSDGRRYFDAGLFAEAGLGAGAHVGIIENDLEAGKNFETTEQTYVTVGIGLVLGEEGGRILNRIQGISFGAGGAKVKRFHIHGKMFPLKSQLARAVRQGVNQSNVAYSMEKNPSLLIVNEPAAPVDTEKNVIKLGNYYQIFFKNTASGTDIHYKKISLLPGNKFEFSIVDLNYPNYETGTIDQKIGTYQLKGDQIKVVYTSEHCKPVGTETFTVVTSNRSDSISVNGMTFNNEIRLTVDKKVLHADTTGHLTPALCN